MQCFKGYKGTRSELGPPGCLGVLGDAFETLYVCCGASLCKFSVPDGACLILMKCTGFSFTINNIYICLCSLFFLLKKYSIVLSSFCTGGPEEKISQDEYIDPIYDSCRCFSLIYLLKVYKILHLQELLHACQKAGPEGTIHHRLVDSVDFYFNIYLAQ